MHLAHTSSPPILGRSLDWLSWQDRSCPLHGYNCRYHSKQLDSLHTQTPYLHTTTKINVLHKAQPVPINPLILPPMDQVSCILPGWQPSFSSIQTFRDSSSVEWTEMRTISLVVTIIFIGRFYVCVINGWGVMLAMQHLLGNQCYLVLFFGVFKFHVHGRKSVMSTFHGHG